MYRSLCLGVEWACRRFRSLSRWGPQFCNIQSGLSGQARQVQSCCRNRTRLYLLKDAADRLLPCFPTVDHVTAWLKAVTLRVSFHCHQSVAGPGCGIDGVRWSLRGGRDRVGTSEVASLPNAHRLQPGPELGLRGWGVGCRMPRTVPLQHHALQDVGYRRTLACHVRCRCSLVVQLLASQSPRILEL